MKITLIIFSLIILRKTNFEITRMQFEISVTIIKLNNITYESVIFHPLVIELM